VSIQEDPLEFLQGDLLEKYESLGINGNTYEALQRGDIRTVILSMLLEKNPDPHFATLMQFMLARDHGVVPGIPGQETVKVTETSRYGRSNVGTPRAEDWRPDDQATLRHVALMLGACSACCGEDVSCPECHGSGMPGSASSIAPAHVLRAWLEPVLGRMGMHITNPALSAASSKKIRSGKFPHGSSNSDSQQEQSPDGSVQMGDQ
jgi:hypothetical protein